MSAITVWDAHTDKTYTYIALPLDFAKTLIRMVEVSSGMFLIADASDDVVSWIPPRIRTAQFTSKPPPEPDPTMGACTQARTRPAARPSSTGTEERQHP